MAVSVTVGGKPATNVTKVSDTQVRFTTPAGVAPGPATVVINVDGETASYSAFVYDPAVTSVIPGNPGRFTPASAPIPGGLAALTALGALGQVAAWANPGDYVLLGDNSHAFWDGAKWVAGDVPQPRVAPDTASPGAPGHFSNVANPGRALDIPQNLNALGGMGALGSTQPWTSGQYIVLADRSEAYWDGARWVAGRVPVANVIPPTGVVAGSPGHFTAATQGQETVDTPADLAALKLLGALGQGATSWTTAQYVTLHDNSHAFWDGTQWATQVIASAAKPGDEFGIDARITGATPVARAASMDTYYRAHPATPWVAGEAITVHSATGGTEQFHWDGARWAPGEGTGTLIAGVGTVIASEGRNTDAAGEGVAPTAADLMAWHYTPPANQMVDWATLAGGGSITVHYYTGTGILAMPASSQFYWDGAKWVDGATTGAPDPTQAVPGNAFPAHGVTGETRADGRLLDAAGFAPDHAHTHAWTAGQTVTFGAFHFSWNGEGWRPGENVPADVMGLPGDAVASAAGNMLDVFPYPITDWRTLPHQPAVVSDFIGGHDWLWDGAKWVDQGPTP